MKQARGSDAASKQPCLLRTLADDQRPEFPRRTLSGEQHTNDFRDPRATGLENEASLEHVGRESVGTVRWEPTDTPYALIYNSFFVLAANSL
jgi:hypothetical protein